MPEAKIVRIHKHYFIEINYTECNFAMIGNFANSDKLKQKVFELIQKYKPEIFTYFI